ncbi:unnamed protein product [Miscanthus lutarioriparius]|uniref:Uncharacterized protein n=1 Tax=Miscanthus lutarioriparius TaxID=422564 RepID=A0A811SB87_9POAL|nr:unnamed protein product [Miscanthus lutarioriparius]
MGRSKKAAKASKVASEEERTWPVSVSSDGRLRTLVERGHLSVHEKYVSLPPTLPYFPRAPIVDLTDGPGAASGDTSAAPATNSAPITTGDPSGEVQSAAGRETTLSSTSLAADQTDTGTATNEERVSSPAPTTPSTQVAPSAATAAPALPAPKAAPSAPATGPSSLASNQLAPDPKGPAAADMEDSEEEERPRPEYDEEIAGANTVPHFDYTKESIWTWWMSPSGVRISLRNHQKTEFLRMMLPRMEETEHLGKRVKVLQDWLQAAKSRETESRALQEAKEAAEQAIAARRLNALAQFEVLNSQIQLKDEYISSLEMGIDPLLRSLHAEVAPEHQQETRLERHHEEQVHLLQEGTKLLEADRRSYAESSSAHTLAHVKAFYLGVVLEMFKDGLPRTITDEEAELLVDSCRPTAKVIASDLFTE